MSSNFDPDRDVPGYVNPAWERWNEARAAERRAAQEMRQAIRDARAMGRSLADIADEIGISRQRVMQLSR
jgi:Sigma-70, region 4